MRLKRWLVFLLVLGVVLLLLPAVALASSAVNAPTLIFPWQQVWPLVIGAVVPLATYVLNKLGPWVSQPIKAFVLVIVSAIANGLYTALATSVFGLNTNTLQLVLTGVAASFAAHHWLWRPSGISTLLGAYADYGVASAWGHRGPPGHPGSAPTPAAPTPTPPAPGVPPAGA